MSLNKPVVFLFTGQGSQYFGMAEKLYKNHKVFKKWIIRFDKIYSHRTESSLIDVLYKTKGRLNNLTCSHAALFAVQYALSQAIISEGIVPDYLLGVSLGEYVAASVANVIEPDEAFNMLITQANIIENNCSKNHMFAILNNIDDYHTNNFLKENTELAIVNHNKHYTIAVDSSKTEIVKSFLSSKNISSLKLPIEYGFHSSLIEPAKTKYKSFLDKMIYKTPEIPVISSMTCDFTKAFSGEHFWKVIREKLNLQKALETINHIKDPVYIDLSPSGSMKTVLSHIFENDHKYQCFTTISPFEDDLQNFQKLRSLNQSNKTIYNPKKLNTTMKAYLFPGQGSQNIGMGKDLFDKYDSLVKKADKILGYSIKELCLSDPDKSLNLTNFTQPALYIVNALSYMEFKKLHGKPDFTAGHSLGEYNALFAAEAFDFETGLKLVKKRGDLMAQAKNGGMAAIIGLEEQLIRKTIDNNNLEIDLANYNSTDQIIISGLNDTILSSKSLFIEAGAKIYIPLKVTGAFHSRYMETASQEFQSYINAFNFNTLTIPVISNVTARPYTDETIADNLIKQIFSPVNWMESIRYLMGQNVEEFHEIGPGTVLTKMVKDIQSKTTPLVISDIPEKKNKNDNNKKISSSAKLNKSLSNHLSITPEKLGSADFCKEYNIKYAYAAGAMYKGIASTKMVLKMANSNLLSFFGTGGLSIEEIEEAIKTIQKETGNKKTFGMNLLCNINNSMSEERTVDLYLKYNINVIEAAAYLLITPAIVKYRLSGVKKFQGKYFIKNRIIAKVSRVEVASQFLSPPPKAIVKKLLEEGKINKEQAEIASEIPMCDDICAEADSAGHTDMANANTLIPSMIKLRNEYMEKFKYSKLIRVGAAGGISTPESAASAFILGADFIVTGSVNQCTTEANTSNAVKDILQEMTIHDTEYAPAADMFEIGAKVQVLKRGIFFPARANKLFDLYNRYASINEIDNKTIVQLEEKYFRKKIEDVYKEIVDFYQKNDPSKIEIAEKNLKFKMSLIFKWYFHYTTQLALKGNPEQKVDYQVHCGPALGAFNNWVKGTRYEKWENRHVDEIAKLIMNETASLLIKRINAFSLIK